MKNELYHHGVKGQRWGVRRYQNEDGTLTAAGRKRYERGQKKIVKAEQYLGRKLKTSDGFSKDGSDITRKRLKNVKQWDEQEKRYKAVKKKKDPSYDYIRGYDLTYRNSLRLKDVDKIIKKMSKDQSLDILNEVQKQHRIKAGKKEAGRILASISTMAISTAAYMYYINKTK